MSAHPLDIFVRRLRCRTIIPDDAAAAILKLPFTRKAYEPSAFLVRERALESGRCCLIESGFAVQQKFSNRARQIVSLHMCGELLNLERVFFYYADHSIQALSRLETLHIDPDAMQKLIVSEPAIGLGLWVETLVNASIQREWTINVGRRPARQRVAHLLCEFALRCEAAGLGNSRSCRLPMTQEQVGDALGLTNVHISRTLKSLATDGIIQRHRREISISDWDAISNEADFDPLYLHLDQIAFPQAAQKDSHST